MNITISQGMKVDVPHSSGVVNLQIMYPAWIKLQNVTKVPSTIFAGNCFTSWPKTKKEYSSITRESDTTANSGNRSSLQSFRSKAKVISENKIMILLKMNNLFMNGTCTSRVTVLVVSLPSKNHVHGYEKGKCTIFLFQDGRPIDLDSPNEHWQKVLI